MSAAETAAAFIRAKLLARCPVLLVRAEQRRPELRTAPILDSVRHRADFARYNDLSLDLDQARALARREADGGDTGYPGLSFGLSTGTTGEPGVFITSRRDRALWLGSFLARIVPPSLWLGSRAAILLRHDSRLYHQTQGRTIHIPLSHGAEACAQALAAARPHIIIGPPSALRRIIEAGLRPPPARLIITGGEPLWPEDAALLADAFAAPVRQVYQAAEGFFAAACRHGRLHVNTDLIRVEQAFIDGAPDRFVPIITDLRRDGPQRMVRYRTDDVAVTASTPCPCGSALPALAGIEGRLADMPITPQGRPLFAQQIHGIVAPILAGAWFRVCQTDGHLTLEVPSTLADTQASRAARRLAEFADMPVTRAILPPLPLMAKFRRTLRLSPPGVAPLLPRLHPPTILSTTARNAARGS